MSEKIKTLYLEGATNRAQTAIEFAGRALECAERGDFMAYVGWLQRIHEESLDSAKAANEELRRMAFHDRKDGAS